jgi:hypothetical protein
METFLLGDCKNMITQKTSPPASIRDEIALLDRYYTLSCAWCNTNHLGCLYKWCHCPDLVYHKGCHISRRQRDACEADAGMSCYDKNNSFGKNTGVLWTCPRCDYDYVRVGNWKRPSRYHHLGAIAGVITFWTLFFIACFWFFSVTDKDPTHDTRPLYIGTIAIGMAILVFEVVYDLRPRGWWPDNTGFVEREYMKDCVGPIQPIRNG